MQQAEKLAQLNAFIKSHSITDADFLVRLGANFPIIADLYQQLYAGHAYKDEAFDKLLNTLLTHYQQRSNAQKNRDLARVAQPNWYSSEQIVGMMLYVDLFNTDFNGVRAKIPYFKELGINTIHLMPFLDVPEVDNDGGYAVRNYRQVNPKFGSLADFEALVADIQENDMNLVMDFVLNHCASTHQWAIQGQQGDPVYKDYFYFFPDRKMPDAFEANMSEIFPDTAPGNFTFLPESNQWVMTLFYQYQWDLNYKNPRVLVEMIDIMLDWSNKGIDIFRFDAVAFMWKEMGLYNQNLPEVHLLLRLFKLCGQIVAPGVAYIAEAIVAPTEIIKYFGEGLAQGDECDIAYNANFMALSWEALATRDTRLLRKSLQSVPTKPNNTTWINYARCHDDIGFGFDDRLVQELGFDSLKHRLYLLQHYCDGFNGSLAAGQRFMIEPETGKARISGSMAALCGLEKALETQDESEIALAIKRIHLQHAIILSLGGLPMIYSGDEIGLPNNNDYVLDEAKKYDNRWLHRSQMNWDAVAQLEKNASAASQIFQQLKHLIALRKQTPAFADNNDFALNDYPNARLLMYSKTSAAGEQVQVVANFTEAETHFDFPLFNSLNPGQKLVDLISGKQFTTGEKQHIGAYEVMWIKKIERLKN
jgi:amylosucrase